MCHVLKYSFIMVCEVIILLEYLQFDIEAVTQDPCLKR